MGYIYTHTHTYGIYLLFFGSGGSIMKARKHQRIKQFTYIRHNVGYLSKKGSRVCKCAIVQQPYCSSLATKHTHT